MNWQTGIILDKYFFYKQCPDCGVGDWTWKLANFQAEHVLQFAGKMAVYMVWD
jgi:hypothetical protein